MILYLFRYWKRSGFSRRLMLLYSANIAISSKEENTLQLPVSEFWCAKPYQNQAKIFSILLLLWLLLVLKKEMKQQNGSSQEQSLKKVMRHPGIEPGPTRWQRAIVPFNQWRNYAESVRRKTLTSAFAFNKAWFNFHRINHLFTLIQYETTGCVLKSSFCSPPALLRD